MNEPGHLPQPIVILGASALLVLGMVVPIFTGLLSPYLQAELGFGDAELGLAMSLFWAATSVLAPILGRLADRHGWQRASVAGAGLAAISLIAFSVGARSWWSLLAVLLLTAVAYAACSPTSNLVPVRTLPPAWHGRALGIKQISPAAVSMIGGLVIPVLAAGIGWRVAYLLPLVFVPLAVWPVLADRRRRTGAGVVSAPGGGAAPRARPMPVRQMAVVCGLGTIGISCTTTFTVRTLVDAGVSFQLAGLIVALSGGLTIVIRLANSWWIDKHPSSLAPVLVLLAGSIAGMALLGTGQHWWAMIGGVVAITCGWGWPPLLMVVVISGMPAQAASAAGTMQIGSGVGNAIGPILFGAVAAAVSLSVGWLLVAALSLAGSILVWRTHVTLRAGR